MQARMHSILRTKLMLSRKSDLIPGQVPTTAKVQFNDTVITKIISVTFILNPFLRVITAAELT